MVALWVRACDAMPMGDAYEVEHISLSDEMVEAIHDFFDTAGPVPLFDHGVR